MSPQPLTPTLSRRERAIERRNLHVYLPLNEEDALTSHADRSPLPRGIRTNLTRSRATLAGSRPRPDRMPVRPPVVNPLPPREARLRDPLSPPPPSVSTP